MERMSKRDLLVSKTWLQAVALVVLFGFFVLGLLAYRTYSGEAPIPGQVVDPGGRVLFTREDIQGGQQVFLRNGLNTAPYLDMEHISVRTIRRTTCDVPH